MLSSCKDQCLANSIIEAVTSWCIVWGVCFWHRLAQETWNRVCQNLVTKGNKGLPVLQTQSVQIVILKVEIPCATNYPLLCSNQREKLIILLQWLKFLRLVYPCLKVDNSKHRNDSYPTHKAIDLWQSCTHKSVVAGFSYRMFRTMNCLKESSFTDDVTSTQSWSWFIFWLNSIVLSTNSPSERDVGEVIIKKK